MTSLLVTPGAALRGSVPCPPDAGVATLACVLASLAEGTSELGGRGLAPLDHVLVPLARLGVAAERRDDRIVVPGRGAWSPPLMPLDCGGSVLALAALAGALVAQQFASALGCDPALGEALASIARALRMRGARIEGAPVRPGIEAPPLAIEPAALCGLQQELGSRGTAVKVSALVSGLFADGDTELFEPIVSDDRCERLLAAMGVELAAAGPLLKLSPCPRLAPLTGALAGDGALAAFLAAAVLAAEGSVALVRGVALSPARSGWLAALREAGGARVATRPDQLGEALGDVTFAGPARAIRLGGERALAAGAPAAALAAIAASCDGESRLDELPAHDLAQAERLLAAFAIEHERRPDGLSLRGGRPRAARFDCAGDADLAMAAVALALAAAAPSRIDGAEAIAARFPRFAGTLRALGASVVSV